MRAEQNPSHAFVCEKRRRGARNAQAFDHLPAFALEFVLRKGGLPRQFGHEFQQIGRELGQSIEADRARVGAGACADVRAHSAQIFFDLAAGAPLGPRPHYRGGNLGQAGCLRRSGCVTAAEVELSSEFRDCV